MIFILHDVIVAVRLEIVDDDAVIFLQVLWHLFFVAIFSQRIDVYHIGWLVHYGLVEACTGPLPDHHCVILILTVNEFFSKLFPHDSSHLFTQLVVFPHVHVVVLVGGPAVGEGSEVGQL